MRLSAPKVLSLSGLGLLAGVGAAAIGSSIWKNKRRTTNFSDRVVLITGGSRGLGFALAQEFALRGAALVICGRDQSVLQEAEARLRAMGAEVLAIACDISSRADAESLVEQATERFGRVDVLVNNAGQIAVGSLESQTIEDFERALGTMFWGMVYTSMAVLPQMKRRRDGRIVNITSIGGKVAVPHLLPYTCAKFAAVGFSEGLHAEIAKDHVRVTTVAPGLMRTGSHSNAIFKGDHRREYSWFSLSASLPVSSMDAHRAARRIVDAAARGVAELVLTPQAQLLALAHGIAPGTVSDLMGVANRFIPGTGNGSQQAFAGKESETAISRSFLTGLGRSAGRDLNQHPEQAPVGGDAHVDSRPRRPTRLAQRTDEVLAD